MRALDDLMVHGLHPEMAAFLQRLEATCSPRRHVCCGRSRRRPIARACTPPTATFGSSSCAHQEESIVDAADNESFRRLQWSYDEVQRR